MFTVDDFINLFTYLKDKSTKLELDDVLVALSESERAKAKELFSTSLDQVVHSTDDYLRLKNFMVDWYASHRTLTSLQKQTTDVYLMPEEQLNELLLSFGYNFLQQPLFTKQNFLLELITLYKGKGTPITLKRLLDFLGFSETDLVEYWLHAIPRDYYGDNYLGLDGIYQFPMDSTGEGYPVLPFYDTSGLVLINMINPGSVIKYEYPISPYPSSWDVSPRLTPWLVNDVSTRMYISDTSYGAVPPDFALAEDTTSFTVSGHVKRRYSPDFYTFMGQGTSTPHIENRFLISFENGNIWKVQLADSSGNYQIVHQFIDYFDSLDWLQIYWSFHQPDPSNPSDCTSLFIIKNLRTGTEQYRTEVMLWTPTNSINRSTYPVYFGTWPITGTNAFHLNGYLANVIISNRQLTEDEIDELSTGSLHERPLDSFNLVFRTQTSDGSPSLFSWPDLEYDKIVSADPHWLWSETEIKDLIRSNKLNVPTKTPYFTFRPNYRQSTFEGIMGLVARIIIDLYKSATQNSLLIDSNTITGEFKTGKRLTGSVSGASAYIDAIIYPNKIVLGDTTGTFRIESVSTVDATAIVTSVLNAASSFDDYVTTHRIIKTQSQNYVTPLELFVACVYAFHKLQYEVNGLSEIPEQASNARFNYYNGDIAVKEDNYDEIIEEYKSIIQRPEAIVDSTTNVVTTRANIIKKENYNTYRLEYTFPILGSTSYYEITGIPESYIGTDFIVGDTITGVLAGGTGVVEDVYVDSSGFVLLYARKTNALSWNVGEGIECDRSGSVFAMQTVELIPAKTGHILITKDDAENILNQLIPEFKLGIDISFAASNGEVTTINLLSDLVNWIMTNVRFDFPNVGAIMMGGELAFRGIFPILDFFKPLRARFIQGPTDFSYIVDNKLFESVIVEDLPLIKEYMVIHDRGTGDSMPEYVGFDYTNGDVVLDSTNYVYGGPREIWDTGAFFDSGIVDDLDHVQINERYVPIDELYCKTSTVVQSIFYDQFDNTSGANELLQDHSPSEYGDSWAAFAGSPNLHVLPAGHVIDLGADGTPSFYYANGTAGYNHRVQVVVRGINVGGTAWIIMRASDAGGTLEYYGVRIRYNQPGSYLELAIVSKSASEGGVDVVRWTTNHPVVGFVHTILAELKSGTISVSVNGVELVSHNVAQYGDLVTGAGFSGIGLSQNSGTSYLTDGIRFDDFHSWSLDNPIHNRYILDSTSGLVTWAQQATGWLNFDAGQLLDCSYMNDIVEISVVIPPPPPPEFIPLSPIRQVEEGTNYEFTMSATSEIGDVSYSLVQNPVGMTIDSTTGDIFWATDTTDVGSYTIIVRATDISNEYTDYEFTMGVYTNRYLMDNFTDTTGTLLSNHISDSGHLWTAVNNDDNLFIDNGKLFIDTTAVSALYTAGNNVEYTSKFNTSPDNDYVRILMTFDQSACFSITFNSTSPTSNSALIFKRENINSTITNTILMLDVYGVPEYTNSWFGPFLSENTMLADFGRLTRRFTVYFNDTWSASTPDIAGIDHSFNDITFSMNGNIDTAGVSSLEIYNLADGTFDSTGPDILEISEEDAPFTYTPTVTFPYLVDEIWATLTDGPVGATINNTTGEITWPTPVAGEHTFSYTITDNNPAGVFHGFASQSFRLTVSAPLVIPDPVVQWTFNNTITDDISNVTPYRSDPTYPSFDDTILKEGSHSFYWPQYPSYGGSMIYSDDVDLPSTFPFKSGTNNRIMTICFWYRQNAKLDGGLNMIIVGKGSQAGRSFEVSFSELYGFNFYVVGNLQTAGDNADIGFPIDMNKWYHVALRFNGNSRALQWRIWDDDAQTVIYNSPDIMTTSPDILNVPFAIGARFTAYASLYGLGSYNRDAWVDKLQIFNEWLSDEQIDAVRTG